MLALLLLLPSLGAAQQRTDVVHGRVVSEEGVPLRAADIFVTRGPDRETLRTLTDSLGQFRVVFANGSGDYLVNVRAFGWQPFRQRLRGASPTDSILSLNVSLKPAVLELDPLKVKIVREKPRITGDRYASATGGGEQPAFGVNAAIPPGQQGDVAATAASVPGVAMSSGGITVLGLSQAQNNVTLNGMAFGGATLPREARTWTRVATAAYDPSRGGFSGAQTAIELAPGGYFTSIRGHITADAPFLQVGDEISADVGQRYTSAQVSAAFDGQLIENKLAYSTAVQAMRSSGNAPTLLQANDDLLRVAGIAPDSVVQFLSALDRIGVPANVGSSPTRTTDQLTLIGRIDHTPGKPKTWGVLAYGDLKREDALALSPFATPTTGGSRTKGMATLLANYSSFFRDYFLNETKSAFTYRWTGGTPYSHLPAGRVLVASEIDDSTSAFAGLSFGGNAALGLEQSDWTWQTTNALQWYNRNSHHRVHLYAESRLDGYSRQAVPDNFGVFTYNSINALRANRPATFSRTVNSIGATGSAWSGVLAASDTWRPSSTFQVLYGTRLEANHFFDRPPLNPVVLETFGARTDNAPQSVHISPRLGFTWIYGGLKEARNYGSSNSILGRRLRTPRGMIRGGIGEFRNFIRPDLLADAQTFTGLAGSRQLLCVGEAVPIPDWSTYVIDRDNIPSTCAGSNPVFESDAPSVMLIAPNYNPERAWRANLSLHSQVGKFFYSVEGVYSLNRNQFGTVDLNFAGVPRFTLSDEGRDVFVNTGSIVPATGVASPVEARISSAFNAVMQRRSDLRSTSRRVTLTVTPDLFMGRYFLSGAYTLGETNAVTRGFDAAAFGDPREEESAPSRYDVRHQIQLQAGISIKRVTLTMFAAFASGYPYTPLVAGDVNGDGLANDRAFVFDPAISDAEVANATRALLDGAPSDVRECLENQFGRPAALFSCRGPWMQTMNAQLQISPRWSPTAIGILGRSNLVLNLANPLGALDLLFHGSDDLRGWGQQPLPDPVLYRVKAFNPQTQRFQYEVNPRFGETRPSRNLSRLPFRITLDVSIDLGRPLSYQQLDRWVKPGRAGLKGQRLSADSLTKLYAGSIPDLFTGVLAQSDSLLLSQVQVDSITAEHRRYLTRMDSLWSDLARYLDDLPEAFDDKEVVARQEKTVDEGWAIAWAAARRLETFLGPQQVRMLPYPASMLLRARIPPKGIRFYTF